MRTLKCFAAIALAASVLCSTVREVRAQPNNWEWAALVIVPTSVVCAVVNTSRLIRGEPKPLMGYVGLVSGLVLFGAGVGAPAIVVGGAFAALSGFTVYSAHKRSGPEAALAPLLSPDKEGLSAGLQVRVRF
jgi:hypothetical protein